MTFLLIRFWYFPISLDFNKFNLDCYIRNVFALIDVSGNQYIASACRGNQPTISLQPENPKLKLFDFFTLSAAEG